MKKCSSKVHWIIPAVSLLVASCAGVHEPKDDLRKTQEFAGTPYDRREYGGWIDEDGDCQDTRQEVLIAESKIPVTYKTERRCKVTSGQWVDPYTGTTYTDPKDLHIDHVVPLAEAHRSGAWAWDKGKKVTYAMICHSAIT